MKEDLLNVVGNFIETELDYVEKSNNEIKQLQNQVEKLTQENNDLEERVIHQDNLIKGLQEEKEHLKGILKTYEVLLKSNENAIRTPNIIEELEKWIKCMQEVSNLDLITLNSTLDKLNELRSKDE